MFVVIDSHPDRDSVIFGPFTTKAEAQAFIASRADAEIAAGWYERSELDANEEGCISLGEDRDIFHVELSMEGTEF